MSASGSETLPSDPKPISDVARQGMALLDRINNQGLPEAERQKAKDELAALIRSLNQGKR